MKPRSALLITLIGMAGCALGGSTVSLGGGQPLSSAAGSSSGSTSGSAGLGAGGGGLNLDDAGIDVTCSDGKKTTLSGTVYDPAGKNALYNAVVYIPHTSGAPLPPFPTTTVSCERCTASVPAKAVALSGANGRFVLENVPAGTVDLVVQLGKWRRKTTLRNIMPCQDNPIDDRNLTRLPRNRSEGDIPKIALSTGHSDALECLLRKIGIEDTEFSTDAGDGRVNLFVGCVGDEPDDGSAARFGANKFIPSMDGGKNFPSTNQLFDSGRLSTYDMVIFSCEGHKCDSIQTPANVKQLIDYADAGGRVFLDHNHYNWLKNADSPIESAAHFTSNTAPSPLVTQIYTSAQAQADGVKEGFPKGDAFAQWLLEVGASTKLGELTIFGAKNSCDQIDNRAQPWIYLPGFPTAGQDANFYFTIGTPVAPVDNTPAPPACGRVVFTDLHVVSAGGDLKDRSDQDTPFPLACITSELSPQEKALEFMIFDLSSCVQKETDVPTAPPPK